MKRVYSLLILLVCGTWLNAQQITISLDTVSANAGDSIVVPVNTSNFVNCGSFTLYIQYNQSVMQWGRALNWNDELMEGIHLANAGNNLIALVWTDLNGASIPSGKLVDLKFRYTGGETALTFATNCEVTDLWGVPVSPAPVFSNGFVIQKLKVVASATPTSLCVGDSTLLISAVTGGFGGSVINWSSIPAGFTSDQTGVWVNPLLTTTYQVMAYDGNDTSYSSVPVTVYNNTPPLPVNNMLPVNGASGLTIPFLLSWSPSGNTTNYDLYIWKLGDPIPSIPTHAEISQISYQVSSGIEYGFTYNWQVVSKNPCLQTSGPIQTFTVRNLPDLIVTNVLTPSTAFSGQNITVSFHVSNTGPGSTMNTQWNDRLYLSTDITLETDVDYFVGDYPNIASLNPGESYVQNISFTLPQGITGYYYLIAITDNGNTVLETSNTNNTGVNADTFLITLSPTPDLQVNKIIIPNSVFSGQPMNISWKVKNQGTAATSVGQWYDRLYLSSDTALNLSNAHILGTFLHNGILGVDSSYTSIQGVTIPNYILGRHYIYVVTDFYNSVYEHALESNNKLRSDSLIIYLTPPPDLEVSNIIVPASASKNEIINVTYTVTNVGGNPTLVSWRDDVYISNSINLNTSTAALLTTTWKSNLAPEAFYTQTVAVKIPDYITGPYYIFVFSDSKNYVFEYTFEENNIGRSANPVQVMAPDPFISTIVTPPASNSGEQVHIHYYNRNNGPGKLIGSWTDKIYISKLATFNVDSSLLVKTRPYTNYNILNGDSLDIIDTIAVPNGISGDYYMFVYTDFYNTIIENAGENNNISRSSTTFLVSLSPWPDLVVNQINYSTDTVKSGLHMSVNFRVKNQGPGITAVSSWLDRIYISTNPFSPASLYTVDINTHIGQLQPDSTYLVSKYLMIPKYLPEGFYYFWIKTDEDDKVYEHTANDNNFMRGDPIYILPYPPGDIVCTAFSAPDSAYSGQNIPVSWTTINQGVVPTSAYCWNDRICLSTDTIYNSSSDNPIHLNMYCGGLPVSGSYTLSQHATIPNGISGDFYIFEIIDYNNFNGDPVFPDNIRLKRDLAGNPKPIHISLTPPPDLSVELFEAPAVIIAGQPFKIKWKVKNIGVGPTGVGQWYDNVLLSSDYTSSNGDSWLYSKIHTGILPVSGEYSDSVEIFVPASISGNYFIIFNTDYSNVVFENNSENNNTVPLTILIQQPPPSDLIVSDIIPPENVIISGGNNFSVSYKIKNQGVNPATGTMKDLIYLSSDTTWDVNDYVVGSVSGIISLGPGAELTRDLTTTVSSISVGNYYVIVRTDVLNNIYESNDTNNIGVSDQTSHIDVPELPLNTWVDAHMTNFIPLYYRIEIPGTLAGEVLHVLLKGDSIFGNNEIYIRFGNSPTRTIFDFNYSAANSGNQEILIPYLQEGTYYLMVYGSTSSTNPQPLRLFAKKLEFSILSIEQNKGGNTSEVTVKVLGSKFTPNMKLFLEKDGTVIEGDSILFIDQSKVFVKFDLAEADTGYYNVMADKFCEGKALLENGFHVIPGQSPNLVINTYPPSAVRPQGIVSIVIEYTNAGNTDLIAPDLEFKSLADAPVSLTVAGLNSGLSNLLLRLREPNGPPDILRPGMSGTITVYTKASKALSFVLKLPNY